MTPSAFELDSVRLAIGSTDILSSITLELPPGSRSMIAGDNGSGKTTLLKAMLGLVRPSSGLILLYGNRVGSSAWKRSRRTVAYVHQESVDVEFPISAEEVVSIGVATRRGSSAEAGRIVTDSMKRTGCEHIAERPYGVLSGGEKQRVSIARCLSQESTVLLLDEPCASLDPPTKTEIIELLEELNEEKRITVVMVTHDQQRLGRIGWRTYEMSEGVLEG